ncbi:uncharacterized protein LOC130898572 [Diorhabda carinulata]|uniref:uncharacterized protein LOC130898572 n=1 Tax=Diorhabda carinulata TaxID=1163345 RepID=UPI0025A1CA65|nr:uncharacterized protein LOC130898572 [Diorhabda carinulata]
MKSCLVSCFVAVFLVYCASGYMDSKRFGKNFGAITKKSHDFCKAVTNVPQDLIDGVRDGQFPNVTSIKCYTTCLWLYAKSMDLDYKMNEEVLRSYMSEMNRNEDVEVMMNCAKEACNSGEKSSCDIGYKMQMCIYENVPKDCYIFF